MNTTSKKPSKWLPIPIDMYRSQMENGYFSEMQFHFKSNIAYSLQHLEFLEIILRDLTLTSVIYTQIVKDYVITSVSIIEVLFFQIAKHEGKIKNNEWRQIKAQDKKTYNDNEKRYRVAEVIYEKLDTPEETIPTFETLIQIVKDNVFFLNEFVGLFTPEETLNSKYYKSNVFIYDIVENETLNLDKIDEILKNLSIEDKLKFIQRLFVENKRRNRFSIK